MEPLDVAFDGLGHGLSAPGQPVLPSTTISFDEIAQMKSGHALPYKGRARVVLQGNSFFHSTPWFSLPDNGRAEADLRFQKKVVKKA